MPPNSRLVKARPGNDGMRACMAEQRRPGSWCLCRSPASGILGRGERKPAARSNKRKHKQEKKFAFSAAISTPSAFSADFQNAWATMIEAAWTGVASVEALGLWRRRFGRSRRGFARLFTQRACCEDRPSFLEGLLGDEQRKTRLDCVRRTAWRSQAPGVQPSDPPGAAGTGMWGR